jgi:hypothetical protein
MLNLFFILVVTNDRELARVGPKEESLLCCKLDFRALIYKQSLHLFRKFKEDVSSAGEQLTSNRIYDGEY